MAVILLGRARACYFDVGIVLLWQALPREVVPRTFTLHEDAWFRDAIADASRVAIGYRIGGMQDGTTARIANFGAPHGDDWRVMRIHADDTQSDWVGHYESFEDALAEL